MSTREIRRDREIEAAIAQGKVLKKTPEGKDVLQATGESFLAEQVGGGRVVYSSLTTRTLVSVCEGAGTNDSTGSQ